MLSVFQNQNGNGGEKKKPVLKFKVTRAAAVLVDEKVPPSLIDTFRHVTCFEQ